MRLAEDVHNVLCFEPGNAEGVAVDDGRGSTHLLQRRHRLGRRRRADQDLVTRGAGDQGVDTGIGEHPAATDHHDVIGDVLHLGPSDGWRRGWPVPPRRGSGGAGASDDSLWVHAVERLVHDDHRRVAEHGGGDAESLAHAERVPARLATCRRAEADEIDHGVDPGWPPWPGSGPSTAGGSRAERLGWRAAASTSAPTWLSGCRRC